MLRDGDLWQSLQHAGCIQVPSLPPSAIDQLLQAFTHFPELHAAMKLLPMRVGQVLIYDHRLLHCSDINSTSDHRPGAVMGLVPAEAELMHYVVDGERIRQYRSNVDFLLSGRTHQGPDDLSPEAWLDHDDTPLRSEQLADFLGAPSLPAHHRKADSP